MTEDLKVRVEVWPVRFLLDTDATNAGALSEEWRQHLEPLEPALSTMYDRHHGLPA